MVIADAGTWLRIGAVSINKRKIKLIRSQGNNVLIDVSGRGKGFHAGNVIAIDYREVTDPQVFGSVGELETWVLNSTLSNSFTPVAEYEAILSAVTGVLPAMPVQVIQNDFIKTRNYLAAPKHIILFSDSWEEKICCC